MERERETERRRFFQLFDCVTARVPINQAGVYVNKKPGQTSLEILIIQNRQREFFAINVFIRGPVSSTKKTFFPRADFIKQNAKVEPQKTNTYTRASKYSKKLTFL